MRTSGKIFLILTTLMKALIADITIVLMTCLIFERMGSQVHFVDAADGGYAMAAVGLKKTA